MKAQKISQIPYGPNQRNVGDLYLPKSHDPHPPILLIHGGSWKNLSKESVEAIAIHLQEHGRYVFNINYRLIAQKPWPACLNDCIAAAKFILEDKLSAVGCPSYGSLSICGASAGGHLAMMTALNLPKDRVCSVISLAGPARLYPTSDTKTSAICENNFLEEFFGKPTDLDAPDVKLASPIHSIINEPPTLHCVHSINDQLVPISHSEDAINAWHQVGARAELYTYDGEGKNHGFWEFDTPEKRTIAPPLASILTQLVNTI